MLLQISKRGHTGTKIIKRKRTAQFFYGINKETVAEAPTFPELWEKISRFIENAPVIVAHSSAFDMGVLKACLAYHNSSVVLP